jgi:hypothetical protein
MHENAQRRAAQEKPNREAAAAALAKTARDKARELRRTATRRAQRLQDAEVAQSQAMARAREAAGAGAAAAPLGRQGAGTLAAAAAAGGLRSGLAGQKRRA